MMDRRTFMGALAGGGALGGRQLGGQQAKRPNVLLLSVDDMNDWVGCLGGYPGVKTPNIDRLAARGALFTDAHCSSPICNPSRTATLTGLRPSTTGIYGNNEYWRPVLPADAETMPEFFRRNGYYAAGAGKIFHHTEGFNPPDQWNEFLLQEFDDPWYRRIAWYPWVHKVPNPDGHPFNDLAEGDFAGEFDWGALPDRPEETYGDLEAVRYGERFLARGHESPFFLALGMWHPHIPLFAPQEFFDLYPEDSVRLPEVPGDDLDDLPEVAQKIAGARWSEHERIVAEGKWKDAVRAYLACISFADRMVGRVLDALNASEHSLNTIVVLWSDHGWHLGEKRHWHKSTLWQRATHVPMVIAGPGVEQPGVRREQPAELLDIYPTLAELCGLETKAPLEGVSLVPQLREPGEEKRPAVITYQRNNHAVLTSKWRYIRYHDGSEELYDRVNDPNDWHNIASQPEHADLKLELAKQMPARNVPQAPDNSEYDFDFQTYSYRLRGG